MSRQAFAAIRLNGGEISGEYGGDGLSLTYTDNASDEIDDISITLQNRTGKWLRAWLPPEGATLDAQIVTKEWTGTLDCGSFTVDDIKLGGWPLTAQINALAAPMDEEFSGIQRTRSWEKATLQEIASTIAGGSGLALEYTASYNPVLDFVSQTDQTNKEFLFDLFQKYGLTLKLYSTKMIIYDMADMEKQSSIRTLRPRDIISFSAHSTIMDTGYGACSVKYTAKDGETLEYTHSAEGKTGKTYECTMKVDNLAEAQRVAEAQLHEQNKNQVTFSCSLPGDTRLVSAVCVNIEGFGRFDGKYFIDKAVHSLGGGYTVNLDTHRIGGVL